MAGTGRKQLVRFQAEPSKERTASYRPNTVAYAIRGASRKQPFAAYNEFPAEDWLRARPVRV